LLKSFLAWTDTQNAYRRNMSFLGRGTVGADASRVGPDAAVN
jgi:hypothetical protein